MFVLIELFLCIEEEDTHRKLFGFTKPFKHYHIDHVDVGDASTSRHSRQQRRQLGMANLCYSSPNGSSRNPRVTSRVRRHIQQKRRESAMLFALIWSHQYILQTRLKVFFFFFFFKSFLLKAFYSARTISYIPGGEKKSSR